MNFRSLLPKKLKEFQSSSFLPFLSQIWLPLILIMVIIDYQDQFHQYHLHLVHKHVDVYKLIHIPNFYSDKLTVIFQNQFSNDIFLLISLQIFHLLIKWYKLNNIEYFHNSLSQSKKENLWNCTINQLGKDTCYHHLILYDQCSKFKQIIYSYNLYN